jgi:hypothetical protein
VSRTPLKFLRNEEIESKTSDRIRRYESLTKTTVRVPVPVEKIVEQVLGLSISWDEIEEREGEMVFGGLLARSKTIVLNEKHLKLFEEKPGLERSTLGHEAAHWDLEHRAEAGMPSLFEEEPEDEDRIDKRKTTRSGELLDVLLDLACRNYRAYKLYKELTEGQDTPDQKSAMDRYQSALLMPEWLVRAGAQKYDLSRLNQIYDFAEEAHVTISNMTTRLKRLRLIYKVGQGNRVFLTEAEATGQKGLY